MRNVELLDDEQRETVTDWLESEDIELDDPTYYDHTEDKKINARIRKRTPYNEAVVQAICTQIMQGRTLRSICDDYRYPNMQTVLKWLADPTKVEFRNTYYNARRVAAELLMDEVIEIADDDSEDYIEKTDRKGNKFHSFNAENVHRAKLRVETRMKLAAKLLPKIYGDHKHTHLELPEELRQMMAEAKNNDKGLPSKPTQTFDNTGNVIND